MKIAVLVVRSLMGLLFLFASLTWFLKLFTPPPLAGPMKAFSEGMEASGYLVPAVKTVELLCGLAFLSGWFVPLANGFLAYVHRDRFRPLLQP